MKNSMIISLDQGSSSSRALAIDPQGKIVAVSSYPVRTNRPQAGLAELDATDLLQGQLAALQDVINQLKDSPVAALAIATQRSTVLFWDKQTGLPLAPALSWQDGRAIAESQAISLSQEKIHQITGLYNTPFYSAAKIAWTLKHLPAVAQAAQEDRLCVGPVASYIIWHLTAGDVFACDPTLAQRTLLFNIQTGDWDNSLLEAFHLSRSWLPQIKQTTDTYGQWKQIPITVCVGDQQAALTALQVQEGQSCINYGTGAFFMHHTGAKCCLIPGLLTSVAAEKSSANQYLLEGPVNACSTVFTWLKAMGFAVENQNLDELCAQAKQPVLLLPALGGLGAPYWNFNVSPVLAGLTPYTTLPDIVAGAIDGIACSIADIVYYAARYSIQSKSIKVAGGFAHNHSLLAAQANVLQQNLFPCVEKEGTAMGAALLAAKALQWKTEQWTTLKLLPQVSPRFTPTQAKEHYQKWQQFVNWCQAKETFKNPAD